MSTLVAIIVCVALVAGCELVRYGVARALGVPVGRIASCFVEPRGGRRWARVVAIGAGTVAMYLGVVALAFASYRHIGIPTGHTEYVVTEAVAGLPAAGKLERGDRIVAVNGAPITRSLSSIANELGGAVVRLTYRRGETTRDVTLRPIGHDGNWVLGLRLARDAGRSHDPVLALQHALVAPVAQVKQSRRQAPPERAEPGGPTGVASYEPPPPPFAIRMLEHALWFASYVLLLVILLDVVRALRALRYSVSTTST